MLKLNGNNLIWIDCEFTGLTPDEDRILEVAVIVTDTQLKVSVEGPVVAVYQSDAVLDTMNAWNRATHGRSGLLTRVKNSKFQEWGTEEVILTFLEEYVPAGKSPMCGNILGQDRQFLARYMSRLHSYFHHSDFDANAFEIAAKRWNPEIELFAKKHEHSALLDTREAIAKMSYYRAKLFR